MFVRTSVTCANGYASIVLYGVTNCHLFKNTPE